MSDDPHDYAGPGQYDRCTRCGIVRAYADYRKECTPGEFGASPGNAAAPAHPVPRQDVFSRPIRPGAFDHIGRWRK